MRISYSRNEDILIFEVSSEGIEYAEEMGPIIVHFSKKGKPVLLEILGASEFMATAAKASMRAEDSEPVEVAF
jgi:hypothetical protein